MSMDIRDKWKEWKEEYLTFDQFMTAIPVMVLFGGGLLVLDKLLNISEKIEHSNSPIKGYLKSMNQSTIGEGLDTIGDELQLINKIAGGFGITINDDDMKKLADWLQNTGTAVKHGNQIWNIVRKFFGNVPGRGQRQTNPTGSRKL